jgi:hypothetical protein
MKTMRRYHYTLTGIAKINAPHNEVRVWRNKDSFTLGWNVNITTNLEGSLAVSFKI